MNDQPHTPAPPAAGADSPAERLPYTPPTLERLGEWSALTLQQSIPIGPGGFRFDPDSSTRLA
jgi:hypothetical protein